MSSAPCTAWPDWKLWRGCDVIKAPLGANLVCLLFLKCPTFIYEFMDVAGKSPEWEGSGSGENMNCAEIPCASDGSDKSFSCVDMNSVTLTPEDGTSSWTKNIELTEVDKIRNSRHGQLAPRILGTTSTNFLNLHKLFWSFSLLKTSTIRAWSTFSRKL